MVFPDDLLCLAWSCCLLFRNLPAPGKKSPEWGFGGRFRMKVLKYRHSWMGRTSLGGRGAGCRVPHSCAPFAHEWESTNLRVKRVPFVAGCRVPHSCASLRMSGNPRISVKSTIHRASAARVRNDSTKRPATMHLNFCLSGIMKVEGRHSDGIANAIPLSLYPGFGGPRLRLRQTQ